MNPTIFIARRTPRVVWDLFQALFRMDSQHLDDQKEVPHPTSNGAVTAAFGRDSPVSSWEGNEGEALP